MVLKTRPIEWINLARKDFEKFPPGAQLKIREFLTVAAEGRKADEVKPMKGLGSGVMEIALAYRSDAYRVIYALQLADKIWVVHAFQKKGKKGRATPKKEIDLIRRRLKRLKETLK